MAGEAVGENIEAYALSAAAVTARNAEYTDTPFTDTDGNGDYDTYKGCNRAGSCAPGIGIGTGFVLGATADIVNAMPEKWTVLDQEGNARAPQQSSHIGGINAATVVQQPDEAIAPVTAFTPAEIDINAVLDRDGTPDFADEFGMAAAIQQAAPGIGIGLAGADPVNRTNVTVEIGEVIWGTSTAA